MIFFLFIIFFILLLFSAFFSSTETIFYLSEEKIKNKYIKVSHESFLIFILLSNTVVNIFIGIVSEKLFSEHLFVNKTILLNIGLTTFILLLFGEILPKRMALIIYPLVNERFLFIMQKWINIIKFFDKIISFCIKPIQKINKEDKIFSINEIKKVLNDGINKGYFDLTQASLISNLISSSMSTVKDNIIHYSEIPVITNSMNFNEIFNAFKNSNLNKIPVVSKNMKQVFGYISKEDMTKFIILNAKENSFDINKFIKPLDMIYEFENIEVAIKRFVETQDTILGVYDEHFQYCGILDYYRLIDNMLFNFPIKSYKNFPIIVKGDVSCRALFYNYDIQLQEQDLDLKLNDLILRNLGRLPKEQDTLEYLDYIFTVSKVKNKKIALITIDKIG